MQKFYEKSLSNYVCLKFQKKVCNFADFIAIPLESIKNDCSCNQMNKLTQHTVYLYFKKKKWFFANKHGQFSYCLFHLGSHVTKLNTPLAGEV